MRPKVTIAALCLLLLTACGGAEPDAETPADTLTQRQRDSILSESAIPGAAGVGRALDVSDSAAARQSAMDSIR